MKIKDEAFFAAIRNYLTIYLPKQKCFSPNTIKSYREALNLLLDYLQHERQIPLHKIGFDNLDHQTINGFLDWLRISRNNSDSTRSQRLMVIRSFVKYAGMMDLAQISIQSELKKVPTPKRSGKLVEYLSEDGVEALFAQPDISTKIGIRDRFFMLLMYDTAARCQEMLDLQIKDFQLGSKSPYVFLKGKGAKTRAVPIDEKTVGHLNHYLKIFHPEPVRDNEAFLFYTTIHGRQSSMSGDNVQRFMKKHGESAKLLCPDIPDRVHPHQLRHTRAVFWYRAGMPMTLLSEILGHADPVTSKIYAYADTEMKREAMQRANAKSNIPVEKPVWENNEDMIRRLYGLK